MTKALPLSQGILPAVSRLVDNGQNSAERRRRKHPESDQALPEFIRTELLLVFLHHQRSMSVHKRLSGEMRPEVLGLLGSWARSLMHSAHYSCQTMNDRNLA